MQPDFFIACVDEACNQLEDEGYCNKLNITDISSSLKELLRIRKHGELLCYFASVEEKAGEEYVFLHSLNYLEMKAFQSILKLNYYDYVLRTDADAILFPGLLYMSPAGSDGWIGSGFSGGRSRAALDSTLCEEIDARVGPASEECHGVEKHAVNLLREHTSARQVRRCLDKCDQDTLQFSFHGSGLRHT